MKKTKMMKTFLSLTWRPSQISTVANHYSPTQVVRFKQSRLYMPQLLKNLQMAKIIFEKKAAMLDREVSTLSIMSSSIA